MHSLHDKCKQSQWGQIFYEVIFPFLSNPENIENAQSKIVPTKWPCPHKDLMANYRVTILTRNVVTDDETRQILAQIIVSFAKDAIIMNQNFAMCNTG